MSRRTENAPVVATSTATAGTARRNGHHTSCANGRVFCIHPIGDNHEVLDRTGLIEDRDWRLYQSRRAAQNAVNAFRLGGKTTRPLALFGRNLPVAALIPLTILWFGIDETQKVMFIFIACAPFVYSDAASAIANVPDRYVETARTLGASSFQIVRKVLVALALPDMYGSLRHLFGLAFGYIMLAELINAQHGLGYLLMTSQRRGLSEHIILILMIIGLLAYGIDRLLFFFQRGLFPHRVIEE